MLDIYNYHIEPTALLGHDERWRLSGARAIAFLIKNPDSVSARNYVLTKPSMIIQYVSKTNEPFIEGEKALANDIPNLIKYYSILNKRSPKLEKQLLRDKDEDNIMLYTQLVMGGEWAEGSELFPVNTYWIQVVLLEFKKALKAINDFALDDIDDEDNEDPVNYNAVRNGSRIDIQDADNNNKVIGCIIKHKNYCILYHGDEIVNSVEVEDVTDETLMEFIHVLSGAW